MKIKFSLDDRLTLNKKTEISSMIIVSKAGFQEIFHEIYKFIAKDSIYVKTFLLVCSVFIKQ